MADLTSTATYRQGIVAMDPRLGPDSIWTAECTGLTQAGPRPGTPEPQRATRAVMQAHGQQEAGAALRILSQNGGFVWRTSADATTAYRGWDPPNVLTGWEAVQYLDGATASAVGASDPHAVTMSSGLVVVVYELAQTAPSTRDVVRCSTRALNGTWSSATVEAQAASYSTGRGARPTIVAIPGAATDRLVCFYMVEPSSSEVQVRAAYSDDSGATWTVFSKACLPASLPYDSAGTPKTDGDYSVFHRMRAAYKDGQILLVISVRDADTDPGDNYSRDILLQYASYDLGHSFVEVVGNDGTAGAADGYTGRYPDLCVASGYFWLAFISPRETDGTLDTNVHVIRLANAGQEFTRTEVVNVGLAAPGTTTTTVVGAHDVYTVTDGECAISGSDHGGLYLLIRVPASAACMTLESADLGVTWTHMGLLGVYTGATPSSTWWYLGTALTGAYPTDFCATWQRGRLLALHSWVATVGNEDASIGCAYLGGWTQVTMPWIPGLSMTTPVKAWDSTWLPIELPDDCGTYTAVGAGTATLTGGAMDITTVANAKSFFTVPSATITYEAGILVYAAINPGAGGSVATNEIALLLRLANGVHDYEVVLRIASGQVRLVDVNAGATVGTTSISTTGGVDVLIAFKGGEVAVWLRTRGLNEDREWTAGPASTSLTDDMATPNAAHRLEIGNIASGTATSLWSTVAWAGLGSGLNDMTAGITNPADLYARRYAPLPVYVDGGTAISLISGPSFSGDSWHIDTRYDYAIDRIFPTVAASPRVGWRSVADSSTMSIALDLDTGLAANCYPGGDTIALVLTGCNWRTGELQGYTGGAWVTIGALDAAGGPTGGRLQSLESTRLGNALLPRTSAADKPWLNRDELVGWTADLAGTAKRRIIGNSAGRWDSAYAGERPTIILAGVDVGDPATPSLRLYPPSWVQTFNLLGANYAAYRIQITNQATVDGYYTIGSILLGPVHFFGRGVAWGTSTELEDLTIGDERADWQLTTRSMAPPRRVIEWGWDEVDTTQVYDLTATPDYYAASTSVGALPVATPAATADNVIHLFRRLRGRHFLACYLPRINLGSTGADVKIHNRYGSHVYGRLTGTLRTSVVLGDPQGTEVVRQASMSLTEEV